MAESGWGAYCRGWRTAVVVLVALGLVTASVFVGWSAIVIAFLMGGTLVSSVHLSLGLAQERPARELVRDVLRWAVRAGLCVVAIAGFFSAIGSATVWLVVLLTITSPPVAGWFWPQLGERVRRPGQSEPEAEGNLCEDPKPQPPQPKRTQPTSDRERKPGHSRKHPKPEPPPTPEPVAPKAPEPVDLTSLSDEDLCLAWRRSFTELQSCTTDEQRLLVIANRHAYLDELERRAPDAFSQWLDSGARAAGNPAKFFSPRTNHGDPD
ncbi:hypothetical protein E1218_09510 [Kribbella turkmenica]|uniref:Uncharacterized protein n=1 Tax=Kribbella turkmenica TaxID=2530375 RepID=A0A4V2YGN3_9ACTN|nr:hypothetical protein [Kribbella turkmenica]TDD27747.1 hypothetical protein E1218_09510 [Kribbella turkmenica]